MPSGRASRTRRETQRQSRRSPAIPSAQRDGSRGHESQLPGNSLGIIGVFADIFGAFLAPPSAQIKFGGAGVVLAVVLEIARKYHWRVSASRKIVVATLLVSLLVTSYGIFGSVKDGRAEGRQALSDTCFGFRDYINASANAATELAAAGGSAEKLEGAEARLDSTLDNLEAAAARSKSTEAQNIVEKLRRQMAAAKGYQDVNVGVAQQAVYEARKQIVELEALCQRSGHAVSAGVDLAILPTVRGACDAFHQFINNGSDIERERTPEEVRKARAGLNLFMYHAEYAGDNELRAAEQSVFQSLAGSQQQQKLATGNATLICIRRGFPRG